MKVDYVDLSASGLRYYLVSTGMDVTPFTIISQQTFQWDHRKVTMGILGASHFLRIDSGEGKVLTELFACAEIEATAASLRSAPFPDLPAKVEAPFAGMTYRFSPRLVPWEDGVNELSELRRAVQVASATHRTWGLEHQFPSPDGDGNDKPPLTLVHAKVGGKFNLKTAHCYPNEDQIVFTTTTMSKKG